MIELKIQASSPDMLRDTLIAFGVVMNSGLVRSTDQVTLTATDTAAPDGTPDIEAWIDQAPDAQLPAEFAAEPEPEPAPIGNDSPERRHTVAVEPKKRGRPRKAPVEPVPDVEPPAEVVTEEDEPEAEGAVEPPEPPAPPKPVVLKAVRPAAPVEYTRDDVRAAVKRVMDAHGPAAAVNRLETIGYKKASDVPDEDFERAINALLGG